MAIEKYIIDKSDLTALLRGECLAIQPKGQIKGFCVEIAGDLTNGDMIKAMFPLIEVKREISSTSDNIVMRDNSFFGAINRFHTDWWNAPYKTESESKE